MPLTNSAFCTGVRLLLSNSDDRCGFVRTAGV